MSIWEHAACRARHPALHPEACCLAGAPGKRWMLCRRRSEWRWRASGPAPTSVSLSQVLPRPGACSGAGCLAACTQPRDWTGLPSLTPVCRGRPEIGACTSAPVQLALHRRMARVHQAGRDSASKCQVPSGSPDLEAGLPSCHVLRPCELCAMLHGRVIPLLHGADGPCDYSTRPSAPLLSTARAVQIQCCCRSATGAGPALGPRSAPFGRGLGRWGGGPQPPAATPQAPQVKPGPT